MVRGLLCPWENQGKAGHPAEKPTPVQPRFVVGGRAGAKQAAPWYQRCRGMAPEAWCADAHCTPSPLPVPVGAQG